MAAKAKGSKAKSKPSRPAKRKVRPLTRQGEEEVVQRIRPTETWSYLRNPHKGCATFQRFNGDPLYPTDRDWTDEIAPLTFPPFGGKLANRNYPDTTIAYLRWVWRVIEPKPGRYRWSIVAGALKAAKARGQTLQVRIQPYTMETPPPDWLWELGAKRGRRQEVWWPYAPGWEPDINHPAYIRAWASLVRSFGKRFNGHPDLESVDIAIGGPYAESGGNASKKTIEYFLNLHARAFSRTELVVNECGRQIAAGVRKGMGWRCDGYGDARRGDSAAEPWAHMYDCYPRNLAAAGAQDAWRKAPVTLESAGVVGSWYRRGSDIEWIIEQGYKYHPTVFMPKSCAIPKEWSEKIERFCRRIGYRFVLRQLTLPYEVTPGEKMRVELFIDNVGCAPIYRPYTLAFRFRQGEVSQVVRAKADIRKWLPEHSWVDERILFPRKFKRGRARVDVAIIDPKTGDPKVKFAIEDIGEDGWHPMGSVDVI